MNIMCPFVRVCHLQIRHMPPNMVFIRTRIPAQDVQKHARVLQRFTAVVTLHHADHVGAPLALVFEPPELERAEEAEGGGGTCVCELFLDQLEGG